MFARNTSGDLVMVHDNNYAMLWLIKFGKKPASSALNTVSVEKMKQYLASKCYSL